MPFFFSKLPAMEPSHWRVPLGVSTISFAAPLRQRHSEAQRRGHEPTANGKEAGTTNGLPVTVVNVVMIWFLCDNMLIIDIYRYIVNYYLLIHYVVHTHILVVVMATPMSFDGQEFSYPENIPLVTPWVSNCLPVVMIFTSCHQVHINIWWK